MKYEKQTFMNQDVLLDGSQFEDCHFDNCNLIFMGIMPPSLIDCLFNRCRWTLDGPATNTVTFMSALYRQGGDAKTLIEKTFDNIRGSNRNS